MTDLLARGRFLLSGDPSLGVLIEQGAAYLADGRIVEVGAWPDLRARHPRTAVVGDERHLVLPGLVNAHDHARGASWLQRGHADDAVETWLLSFRGAAAVDAELDARYAGVRLLRSGVTTVLVSHYVTGPDAEGQTRAMLAGLRSTGIRVALAVGLLDRSAWQDPELRASLPPALAARLERLVPATPMDPAPQLALFTRLWDEAARDGGRGHTVLLGPVSPLWSSDELLSEVARIASRTGAFVHTHALETRAQAASARRRHGRSLLAHLATTGFLTARVSLAHCVVLADEDVDALATTGATVVHNPGSNLRLRSGVADIARLRARGVPVALGTDSQGLRDDEDLLIELGLASVLARGETEGGLDGAGALAMATVAGSRAAGLGDDAGAICPGALADLTLLDLEALAGPPGIPAPAAVLELVVGRATAASVDTVIVGGSVVLAAGRSTLVDADEVARRLSEALAGIADDPVSAALVRDLAPHVEARRRRSATEVGA